MATRGMNKVVSDMDEHGKLKADIKVIIKESMDALASKDDKVISASIKKKCDEKFGPMWNCIVGEDFKTAFAHENKVRPPTDERARRQGESARAARALACARPASTGTASLLRALPHPPPASPSAALHLCRDGKDEHHGVEDVTPPLDAAALGRTPPARKKRRQTYTRVRGAAHARCACRPPSREAVAAVHGPASGRAARARRRTCR
jgi:hypothetical protein